MSISSSLLPSTRRSMRGGANHQRSILTPQRHMRRLPPVRHLSSMLHPSGPGARRMENQCRARGT
jgi:hypothetical protein